jgi:murein DD-endopeptidase MepM/ murein hydrolase activator NlpD
VRIRPTLLVCAALVALSIPGPAAADPSGGIAVPGGDTASGGSAFGTPAPPAEQARAKRRARAQKRRAARRAERRRLELRTPTPPEAAPGDYAFPVAGAYSLDGEAAVFGAPRSGHRHMGHDISAARGTPVVAPYAGVVEWVRYQRAGAGHYVVLGGADGYDYVFMHLRRGSIVVAPGQSVATGQTIAEVGNSGRSFGAHLHFEVWVGGWYEKGGEPIDPLPLLADWATR